MPLQADLRIPILVSLYRRTLMSMTVSRCSTTFPPRALSTSLRSYWSITAELQWQSIPEAEFTDRWSRMITEEKDDCRLLIQWLWTGRYSLVAKGLLIRPSLDSLDTSLACPTLCHDTNGSKIPQDGQSCIHSSCGGTSSSTPYPNMTSPTRLGGSVDTIVRTLLGLLILSRMADASSQCRCPGSIHCAGIRWLWA